jgi:hypothetical protein
MLGIWTIFVQIRNFKVCPNFFSNKNCSTHNWHLNLSHEFTANKHVFLCFHNNFLTPPKKKKKSARIFQPQIRIRFLTSGTWSGSDPKSSGSTTLVGTHSIGKKDYNSAVLVKTEKGGGGTVPSFNKQRWNRYTVDGIFFPPFLSNKPDTWHDNKNVGSMEWRE